MKRTQHSRGQRVRKWLHDRGHHRFCRVVVDKVIVGYTTDFSPEWLVGVDEDGAEIRIDATMFGGRQIPVEKWKVLHS